MKRKKSVRIVPIVSDKPGHKGNVTGWHVHPDDRVVRELPPARETDDKSDGEAK